MVHVNDGEGMGEGTIIPYKKKGKSVKDSTGTAEGQQIVTSLAGMTEQDMKERIAFLTINLHNSRCEKNTLRHRCERQLGHARAMQGCILT